MMIRGFQGFERAASVETGRSKYQGDNGVHPTAETSAKTQISVENVKRETLC